MIYDWVGGKPVISSAEYEWSGGAPYVIIDVTGGDPNLSNDPTSYAFGVLAASATASTGLNYFTITNSSGFAIDISISGTDMIGGVDWDLADDGNPGADIYAMKAGLDGGSYNIIVRETAPFNTLKAGLANGATQAWGMQLLAPTSFSDGVPKSGTITITGAAS